MSKPAKREYTVTVTVIIEPDPSDTDAKIIADLMADLPKFISYDTRDLKIVRKHRII